MAEQPDAPSPFHRVDIGPIPADHPMLDASGFTDVAALADENRRRDALSMVADAFGPLIVGSLAAPLVLARKVSAVVPMTPELIAEHEQERETAAQMLRFFNGDYTPEERAAAEARRAAWKADRERRHAEAVADWQQLRERHADSPAVLAVLDIHRPDSDGGLECAHPVFGYESDAEDWPCSTFEAIKGAVT